MSDTLQQPGLNSLSKSFEPAAIEAQWGPEWEKRGYGVAGFRGTGQPEAGAESFAIQLPPPNVTGTLHMGHAFNQTIMDSLTRYHRMLGANKPLSGPLVAASRSTRLTSVASVSRAVTKVISRHDTFNVGTRTALA